MKRLIKRFVAAFLIMTMLLPLTAMADQSSVLCLGADLSEEQRLQMQELLVPANTSMRIVTVTNQEERALLGSYIPASQIGTRSISSASVKLGSDITGISVSTHNITWVTGDMYKSALITAGIHNAQVRVGAPFEVSGTAALAGIYKAYEAAAGFELSAEAKAIAGEELSVTGMLGEFLGREEASALIAQLKEDVIANGYDNAESIRPAVREAAKELGIEVNDSQVEIITSLLLKLLSLDLDPEELTAQVQSMAKTIDNLLKAQKATETFFGKVSSTWGNVVDWFKGIFTKK